MKKMCRALVLMTVLLLMLTLVSCGVKVTFDIGDATLVSGKTVQHYTEDKPISAPVLEKEGYKFLGWDTDFSAPTDAITVKPVWKRVHIIVFEIGEGEASDPALLTQEVLEGDAVTIPEVTREGYAFCGWNKDLSVIESDMTVTAEWKKLYKVTFDLDGGTVPDKRLLEQNVADGESANIPEPTRDKYNFVKWDKDISSVTGDMQVKAIWERKTFTSTEIFNLASPATVEIKTYRLNHNYFGMGSGFFINEDGLILTNYHVIKNARAFWVETHDGQKYLVNRVVAYDVDKDIAVLQVNTRGEKVAYLELAESLPKAGEAVWAIGSSLGLTGTFSSGIVSYINREVDGVKFIQTTTPISSGNSGGPLVNEQGYVVGINSASYTEGQNLNLAVEISQYRSLKNVNLSPEALFQKEGTLKYWIGEVIVDETAQAEASGQTISNGTTIKGHHDGGDSYDFYMTECPKENSAVIVMVRADNEETLKNIYSYLGLFVANQNVKTDGRWLSNDLWVSAGMIEDDDGKLYAIGVAALPEGISDYGKHFGVAVYSTTETDYEIFMYYVTEEMVKELN